MDKQKIKLAPKLITKLIVGIAIALGLPLLWGNYANAKLTCLNDFMCNYDVSNYQSRFNVNGVYYDQPILRWEDNPSWDFAGGNNATVFAGQTIHLTTGYNSFGATTTYNGKREKVITWINVPGGNNIFSDVHTGDNLGGSYSSYDADANRGFIDKCFNVLNAFPGPSDYQPYPGNGSPYSRANWNEPGGGTVLCDSALSKERLFSGLETASWPGGTWTGHTSNTGSGAVWMRNSEVNLYNQGLYDLKFTIRSDITIPTTFCMRTHVSVLDGNVSFDVNNPDARRLGNVMAIGAVPLSGDAYCFNVKPLVTPPPQPPYLGVDDPAVCPTISGFAFDLDNTNASTRVDIYADAPASPSSTPVWSDYASEVRADVNTALGVPGNHGFHAEIPTSIRDGGVHTLYIYAIDESNTVTGVGPAAGISGHAGNGHIYGTDPITINTADCAHKYRFDPIAVATPKGTTEDPGQIKFEWGNGYLTFEPISGTTPSCVNGISVSYTVFKVPANSSVRQPITSGSNGGTGCTGYAQNPWTTYMYTVPAGYQAGDSFCVDLIINPSEGFVKTDGTQVQVIAGEKHGGPACVTIKNKPYFNIYGSGVSSGGSFNPVCGGGGVLAGWNDNSSGTGIGAGTQLSALALVNIVGFASGQKSATAGVAYGQTFAREGLPAGSITSSKDSPKLGGLFGSTHCIQTPPEPTDAQDLPASSYQIQSLPSLGTRSPYKHTGNLTLNPSSGDGVNPSQNASIFVTGDVYIANNIVYGSGWSINNVPSLVVYASGNIFIDPRVTMLDGRYVAKGKIYTCATGFGAPVSQVLLYDQCSNQLTVFGSFSASQINLMRTFGSLRNGGGAVNCSSLAGAIRSSNKSCAAEVFDFSPEMYLAEPAVGPPTENVKQYESITNLPPVL